MTPLARRVLDLVDAIPPGRVLTYGDVRDAVGQGSPRTVGTVLARYGDEVPWHRVCNARGEPPAGSAARVLELWRVEGTPTLPDGRADLRRARWAAAEQAEAAD